MNTELNLLNRTAVEDIIARVKKLTVDHQALWGKMNVTEMLYHCNQANRFILEDKAEYKKPSIKQTVIRFICFRILSKIPRNNPQPERINARGLISQDQFLQEQANYIRIIQQFPSHKEPFTSLHPRMGFLDNIQWGRIAWMHMDHHLRQFGV